MINPNNAKQITPKNTFSFSCTQCGECCFDQLVLLNPFDLFYLSRFGELPNIKTSTELFENNYVELIQIDEEWRCALVMPKFQKGTKCRFLTPSLNQGGKLLSWFCELHQKGAKPLVCISSPIAQDMKGKFYLVPPVDTCPGMNQGRPEQLQDSLDRLDLEGRLAAALKFYRSLQKKTMTKEEVLRLYNFDRKKVLSRIKDVADHIESFLKAA